MEFPLFDTHAHLISDDWERYPPLAVKPGLPTRRTDYTVTADGKGRVRSIKIDRSVVDPADIDMLEDLVLAAVSEDATLL